MNHSTTMSATERHDENPSSINPTVLRTCVSTAAITTNVIARAAKRTI